MFSVVPNTLRVLLRDKDRCIRGVCTLQRLNEFLRVTLVITPSDIEVWYNTETTRYP